MGARRVAVDRATTKRAGSAGSASPTAQLAHLQRFDRSSRDAAQSDGLHRRPAARHGRLEPRPRGAEDDVRPDSRASPSSTCSTRPIPAQVKASRAGSISRARCSSSRASRARRSSRTSSSSTSSSAPRARRPEEAGSASSPSPIPARSCSRWPRRDGFRHIFSGWPDIGGRYSALSDFGLVPAALMGVDVAGFLDRTDEMVCACMPSVPPKRTRASCSARSWASPRAIGRDKVTIVASPRHRAPRRLAGAAGRRVRQGRQGHHPDRPRSARAARGLRRRPALRLSCARAAPDAAQDEAVGALERPASRWCASRSTMPTTSGQEFFRWEIATAVAGSILGINPFDQPDVEASKIATRQADRPSTSETGALPAETPIFTATGDRAVRRREERRRARRGARARHDASRAISPPISIASARATTSRCWPTST